MRLLRYGIALFLAAAWIAPLHAQEATGTIRGRVTDASSQLPLRAATVRVGSRSAETRADGGYLLTDVPPGPDSVRVSMIGYAPLAQVVTVVAGQTVDVDFALTSQAVNLAEMVVVGYGEQRQGNITGTVTNVTPEEFNTGRVVTPTELIQNKVAGRAGHGEQRARREDLDPDSRPDIDQREQRAALRHRRAAAGRRRRWWGHPRPRPTQLPEPR